MRFIRILILATRIVTFEEEVDIHQKESDDGANS